MSDYAAINLGDFGDKPRRGAPVFTEKTFYLEEFYGKSLLFALIPPAGQRISDFDSLLLTLRELRRNQTRCVVIVSPSALPKLMRRLGRLADHGEPFLDREQPLLVGIGPDTDDEAIAQGGRVSDDVEMAVGRRVERAGIECDAEHA